MNLIPFTCIDWSSITKEQHDGETGVALWQVVQYPGLRVRIVEYKPNYKADHWCQKGHIVQCLEGEFINEQENGDIIVMKKGMTYVVSDDQSSHRSISEKGARLLIIDGDFLGSDLK